MLIFKTPEERYSIVIRQRANGSLFLFCLFVLGGKEKSVGSKQKCVFVFDIRRSFFLLLIIYLGNMQRSIFCLSTRQGEAPWVAASQDHFERAPI